MGHVKGVERVWNELDWVGRTSSLQVRLSLVDILEPFTRYWLSAFCIPGTVLGALYAPNKKDKERQIPFRLLKQGSHLILWIR